MFVNMQGDLLVAVRINTTQANSPRYHGCMIEQITVPVTRLRTRT